MKVVLILTTIWIVVESLPVDPATITKYNFDYKGKGYSYEYESSDGTKREETGEILNEGQENESLAVKGSYLYTGPDNTIYEVKYIADENGFQPVVTQHPSIPTAPAAAPVAVLEISSHALISLGGASLG